MMMMTLVSCPLVGALDLFSLTSISHQGGEKHNAFLLRDVPVGANSSVIASLDAFLTVRWCPVISRAQLGSHYLVLKFDDYGGLTNSSSGHSMIVLPSQNSIWTNFPVFLAEALFAVGFVAATGDGIVPVVLNSVSAILTYHLSLPCCLAHPPFAR